MLFHKNKSDLRVDYSYIFCCFLLPIRTIYKNIMPYPLAFYPIDLKILITIYVT